MPAFHPKINFRTIGVVVLYTCVVVHLTSITRKFYYRRGEAVVVVVVVAGIGTRTKKATTTTTTTKTTTKVATTLTPADVDGGDDKRYRYNYNRMPQLRHPQLYILAR